MTKRIMGTPATATFSHRISTHMTGPAVDRHVGSRVTFPRMSVRAAQTVSSGRKLP
jgi:hypothetical protein